MRDQIEEQLKILIGLPVTSIGRASNMIWVGFGCMKVIKGRLGKERKVSEYALHVQCNWRLKKIGEIVLDSNDIYVPSSKISSGETHFDWSVIGNSRFDERVQEIFDNLNIPFIVQSVKADEVGGLKMSLSNNFIIDIFPDLAEEGELWRLLQPGQSEEHFVVTTEGIEN